MLRRFYSWIVGRRIGETAYTRATPFIVGPIASTLPFLCWTKAEKEAIRLCYRRHEWDGFRWVFTDVVEMPPNGIDDRRLLRSDKLSDQTKE